ncbi:HAMP domain-containing sensor histidine kinase [Haloarculaceae archaeon H-GB11]|nr:HAMP domain-containing sensor histidine kinase [Haloarculaceae archaeon H-GB11]
MFRDVSDRRERISELKHHRERLGEFTDLVSRDLRNPLNVAMGELELARLESDFDHLDGADAALERMDALIDDLLALAEMGARVEGRDAVSISDVARTAWTAVDTGDATLTVEPLPDLRADADRLEVLFEQLFSNAATHGPTEGSDAISVTVGGLDADGLDSDSDSDSSSDYVVSYLDDRPDRRGGDESSAVSDSAAGFYVEDVGEGITSDDLERVFEPGYSTAAGTGFGLTIVGEIAAAHGWRLSVTERDGGGVRFEIRTDVERIR